MPYTVQLDREDWEVVLAALALYQNTCHESRKTMENIEFHSTAAAYAKDAEAARLIEATIESELWK